MGGLVGALILGIVGSILHGELAAWAPRICHLLIGYAAWIVPSELRERLREEWAADVERIPGPYSKLIYVMGIFLAGVRIGAEHYAKEAFSSFSRIYLNNLAGRVCATIIVIFFAPLLLIVAIVLGVKEGKIITLIDCGSSVNRYKVIKFNATSATLFGKLLIVTSIDALPMLINVMRGEIAFFTPIDVYGNGYYRDPIVARVISKGKSEASCRLASLIWEYRRQKTLKTFVLLVIFSLLSLLTVEA